MSVGSAFTLTLQHIWWCAAYAAFECDTLPFSTQHLPQPAAYRSSSSGLDSLPGRLKLAAHLVAQCSLYWLTKWHLPLGLHMCRILQRDGDISAIVSAFSQPIEQLLQLDSLGKGVYTSSRCLHFWSKNIDCCTDQLPQTCGWSPAAACTFYATGE